MGNFLKMDFAIRCHPLQNIHNAAPVYLSKFLPRSLSVIPVPTTLAPATFFANTTPGPLHLLFPSIRTHFAETFELTCSHSIQVLLRYRATREVFLATLSVKVLTLHSSFTCLLHFPQGNDHYLKEKYFSFLLILTLKISHVRAVLSSTGAPVPRTMSSVLK